MADLIDDIVEMIFKEARSRKGDTLLHNIFSVISDIDDKVGPVADDLLYDDMMEDFPELKNP